MKPKLLLCLALVLSGGLFGCSTVDHRSVAIVNTATFIQNIFKKIEQELPELASAGAVTGPSPFTEAWHGEEYAGAKFFLAKNPRYTSWTSPKSEFSRTTPLPDIVVTINHYASSGEVQQDIEKSLFGFAEKSSFGSGRAVAPEPKEKYKGAILYRFNSGGGDLVCQDGLYVVEITPINEGASPLTMKVLDVVLAELDSTSSSSR